MDSESDFTLMSRQFVSRSTLCESPTNKTRTNETLNEDINNQESQISQLRKTIKELKTQVVDLQDEKEVSQIKLENQNN